MSCSECAFHGEQESYSCGYCHGKKQKARCTHGATFSTLTTEDYQALMFRGWRRSGSYCYKPVMEEICCPQYTIRCDVARYRLSRAHRRVLKGMDEFLRTGARPAKATAAAASAAKQQANNSNAAAESSPERSRRLRQPAQAAATAPSPRDDVHGAGDAAQSRMRKGKARQKRWARRLDKLRAKANSAPGGLEAVMAEYQARRAARAAARAPMNLQQLLEAEGRLPTGKEKPGSAKQTAEQKPGSAKQTAEQKPGSTKQTAEQKPGSAKQTAEQKPGSAKQTAEQKPGSTKQTAEQKPGSAKQTAEQKPESAKQTAEQKPGSAKQTAEPKPGSTKQTAEQKPGSAEKASEPRHRLRVVLLPSARREFDSAAEHPLYARYQNSVHGDAPTECNLQQFRRFLCDSPLVYTKRGELWLGSFHQQYWLEPEGRLIMVGVVDVLPDATSSVYVFYDPDYAWLNLGTYAALREIALTMRLGLPLYCMGYYIHDCVKMRYKGAFAGSELLCPKTYTWHCLRTVCVPLLRAKDYCSFAPPGADNAAAAPVPADELQVALGRRGDSFMAFGQLSGLLAGRPESANVDQLVRTFARLVGPDCARRIRVRIY